MKYLAVASIWSRAQSSSDGGSTEVAGQDWLWLEGLHSAQDWEALLGVPMGLDPVLPALLAWGLQGLT